MEVKDSIQVSLTGADLFKIIKEQILDHISKIVPEVDSLVDRHSIRILIEKLDVGFIIKFEAKIDCLTKGIKEFYFIKLELSKDLLLDKIILDVLEEKEIKKKDINTRVTDTSFISGYLDIDDEKSKPLSFNFLISDGRGDD